MRLLSKEISVLVPRGADSSAEERMAEFLLDLSRRLGERGYSASDMHLSMARKDIANFLRLATETVSRVLRRFQNEGWIDVQRRDIRILEPERLRDLSRSNDRDV
jgi:CRP/FNR family transcriptional regulator